MQRLFSICSPDGDGYSMFQNSILDFIFSASYHACCAVLIWAVFHHVSFIDISDVIEFFLLRDSSWNRRRELLCWYFSRMRFLSRS